MTDGLVDNNIRAIASDDKEVWIGTENGVSRFDKENTWENYTTEKTIGDNYITNIVDDNEHLWFNAGKYYYETIREYNKLDGSFKTYSNKGQPLVSDGRYVWFNDTGKKVFRRYDKINNSWKTYNIEIYPGTIYMKPIEVLMEQDTLWIGRKESWYYGGDIFKYDKATDTWQEYDVISSSAIVNKITSNNNYNNNYTFFATSEGLLQYDKSSDVFTTILAEDTLSVAVDGNYLWCGTSSGVVQYDLTDRTSKLISATGGISIIHPENENVWFSDRVNIYRYKKPEIEGEEGIFEFYDSVGDKYISGIFREGNYLWVKIDSSSYNGFRKQDIESKIYRDYEYKGRLLPYTDKNFVFDRDIIYIGTDKGLFRHNRTTDEIKEYSLFNSLISNWIHSIAIDGKDVWIATTSGPTGMYGGLSKYDRISNSWITYISVFGLNPYIYNVVADEKYVYVTSYSQIYIYNKIEDIWNTLPIGGKLAVDKEYLWIGSGKSLIRVNKTDWLWETFKTFPAEIEAIAVDENDLWVAAGNLYRYNKAQGYWKEYGVPITGLTSLSIDNNNIWLGGWYNASRFDKVNETFRNYDFLTGGVITSISSDRESVWFGTPKGLSRLKKMGALVFERTQPVSIAGEVNVDIPVGQINSLGKFSVLSSLKTQIGQKLKDAQNSFIISNKDVVLYFDTDKKLYKQNEQIKITGGVVNRSAKDVSNITFTLNKGAENLITEVLTLSAGQEYSFSFTTTSSYSFILEGRALDSTLSEYIEIIKPDIDIEFASPDVTGRDEFNIDIKLKNKYQITTAINLKILKDEEEIYNENINLSSEELKIISLKQTITKDTSYKVIISGDVNKTLEKNIIFGENISISFSPEPIYPEGVVKIPYKIANTGELSTFVIIDFAIGDITRQRFFYLPKGYTVEDEVFFPLTEGTHTLKYSSFFGEGGLQINVAKYNKLAINNINILSPVSGKIPVEVELQNTGAGDFIGNVQLKTEFYSDEREIGIGKGEEMPPFFGPK